jgi:ferredoxin-NADP reductase
MARTARRLGREDLLRIVTVGRTPQDLPYADELARHGATLAWTRQDTEDRPAGPPSADDLAPLLSGVEVAYVCGSARFAAYAETLLVECGLDPQSIRVERFGPTG